MLTVYNSYMHTIILIRVCTMWCNHMHTCVIATQLSALFLCTHACIHIYRGLGPQVLVVVVHSITFIVIQYATLKGACGLIRSMCRKIRCIKLPKFECHIGVWYMYKGLCKIVLDRNGSSVQTTECALYDMQHGMAWVRGYV